MKRLILFFLLAPFIGFAQDDSNKAKFGFSISPGIALTSKDPGFTSLGYQPKSGGSMQAGFRYHKPISKHFGFGSEVLFHWKNVIYRKRNTNITTICLSGPCDKEDEAYDEHHFNASSIDLNAYGTIHSGLGSANPYLLVGINPSFLLSGKYKYNNWSTSGTIAKETWETGKAEFKPVSLGFVTGIGAKAFLFNHENLLEIRALLYTNDQVEGLNSRLSVFKWSWTLFFD